MTELLKLDVYKEASFRFKETKKKEVLNSNSHIFQEK